MERRGYLMRKSDSTPGSQYELGDIHLLVSDFQGAALKRTRDSTTAATSAQVHHDGTVLQYDNRTIHMFALLFSSKGSTEANSMMHPTFRGILTLS